MNGSARQLCGHAATLLNGTLSHFSALSGGDLSAVYELRLEDGRTAVVKTGPSPLAEGAMLKAIRNAGVAAPEVYAADKQVLVIEKLDPGGSLSGVWSVLGSHVRRLHAATAPQGDYGWPEDYAFGKVAIPNGQTGSWPEFWVTRRLEPSLASLPGFMARRLENLCSRIEQLLPARPHASLLHGDLWAGNVLVTSANLPYLIDPACYFGHSEVDLAMLALFASPSPAFYEAYGSLEPEHETRMAVYSLWPALVHFRLFGSGYGKMVDGFLTRAGF